MRIFDTGFMLRLLARTMNLQCDSALIRGHKRLQILHQQRSIHLAQLVLNQSRVYSTHRRCLAVNQVVLHARNHGEPEGVFIEFRLQAHILEVCVKRVNLMLRVDTNHITLIKNGVNAPQQVTLGLRLSSPRICLRVYPRRLNRFKYHRRPPTATSRNRVTRNETFVFEHLQMIARRVDMKANGGRKFLKLLTRNSLDFVQQFHPAGLSQPAIVLDSTGHNRILLR